MNNHFASAATAVLAAAMAMILGAPGAHAAQEPPHARVLVTHRIDERRLVRLAGNTRREANARNDRGRVREDFLMEHMLLLLKRPPELEEQFEQYTVSLTDRSSANFRHWLTADQQGESVWSGAGFSRRSWPTAITWLLRLTVMSHSIPGAGACGMSGVPSGSLTVTWFVPWATVRTGISRTWSPGRVKLCDGCCRICDVEEAGACWHVYREHVAGEGYGSGRRVVCRVVL